MQSVMLLVKLWTAQVYKLPDAIVKAEDTRSPDGWYVHGPARPHTARASRVALGGTRYLHVHGTGERRADATHS